MSSKIIPICLTIASSILLGACSKGAEKVTDTAVSPMTSAAHSGEHDKPHHGGMTIETNGIHLEMVPAKEANKTQLNLYVDRGEHHEPIPNAKIVAQVQTPDGKQQSLDMKYADADKRYTVASPSKIAGQYQVKIMADISGKKIDGRFTFDR